MTIVFDLDEATYRSGTDSLSASAAKILLGTRPPESQAALEFGRLAHAVLLEPDKAAKDYICLDAAAIGVKADGTPAQVPTMTAAWKRAVAAAEQAGQTVVATEDWQRANDMADAVRKHKRASELLAECPQREVSAYAEIEPGVMVRGRFDLLGPGSAADYKTALDGDPEGFGRIAAKYGYYIQAAVYRFLAHANGIDIDALRFILCEKDPTPGGNYRVSVTRLDDMYVAKGLEDFKEAVRRWLALERRVDLPDYPDEEVLVPMPDWLISDDEMVI